MIARSIRDRVDWPVWLQSGQEAGLHAGCDHPDRNTRRIPPGLRSDARQYIGEDNPGGFQKKIEDQYSRSERVWVMDRGMPTETTLTQIRTGTTSIIYPVGTPRVHLYTLNKDFLNEP